MTQCWRLSLIHIYALRTIDFEGIVGIQLADPESVDESGYPTRMIVIPVMISEAVSENGAEVELPYGVLDKGWKVNIFWELNFEGAGINVGDGYSMVGKKDISADLRNSLQKKYVFRDCLLYTSYQKKLRKKQVWGILRSMCRSLKSLRSIW